VRVGSYERGTEFRYSGAVQSALHKPAARRQGETREGNLDIGGVTARDENSARSNERGLPDGGDAVILARHRHRQLHMVLAAYYLRGL
jgi:hypothetical protein